MKLLNINWEEGHFEKEYIVVLNYDCDNSDLYSATNEKYDKLTIR